MKKSEMFNILADKVCEVCEVKKEDILTCCKRQSVVDARILLVQYLKRIGLSNDDIAEIVLNQTGEAVTDTIIKKKAKGVQKMFDSYSVHCLNSYAFCLMSKEIKDFCHERYSEHYMNGMKQLPN